MKKFLIIFLISCVYAGYTISVDASTHLEDDYEKLIKITFKKSLSSIKELRKEHLELTSLTEDQPSCFLSYAWGSKEHEDTFHRLGKDLKKAGINVKLDIWHNRAGTEIHRFTEEIDKVDFVVIAGTKILMAKYEKEGSVVNLEIPQIADKIRKHRGSVIPIILEGDKETSLPPLLRTLAFIEFQQKENYFKNVFHLLSQLYKLKADDICMKDIAKDFSKKQKSFLDMPHEKRSAYVQRLQQQKLEEKALLAADFDNDIEEMFNQKQKQLEEKKKKIIKSMGKETNKEPVLETATDKKTEPSNDSSFVSSPSIGPSVPQEDNKQPSPLPRKKQLEQKANAGDAQAQYELGVMFRDGNEVRKKPDEAITWLDKAALKEHVDAMNALSRLYLEGKGVIQDYAKALEWNDKLVELNNPEAQNRLGDMYKNGWGVEKDEQEALKWYQKAADQDYEPAIINLKLTDTSICEALHKVKAKTLSITTFTAFVKSDLSLTTLNLYRSNIGDEGAKVLAPALKAFVSLQELSLSVNRLGDEGAKTIAESLKCLTLLTELSLGSNHISVKGAQALAPSLKELKRLVWLNLSDNKIGNEGSQIIARSLKDLTRLTWLHFSSNQIGIEGAKALAIPLKYLTSLKELYLDNNKISDEGVQALAPALKGLASLQVLDLSENHFRNEGAKALAIPLKYLTSLTKLYLVNNLIGDEGAQALVISLTGLTFLIKFDIGGNYWIQNSNALGDLKRSRPSLKLHY